MIKIADGPDACTVLARVRSFTNVAKIDRTRLPSNVIADKPNLKSKTFRNALDSDWVSSCSKSETMAIVVSATVSNLYGNLLPILAFF